MNINVENKEGIKFLTELPNNSVDLILTDPPYLISKDSGMNKFVKEVAQLEKSGKNKKTQEEWTQFKQEKGYTDDKYKENYIKYGNTSGKKYGYKTEFGEWDKEFTLENMQDFIQLFYRKLKKGGTCIIFFDLWKIETLKKLMEEIRKTKQGNWIGFKQIRFVEWIKGVKGGKPTFNSKYDKGIYEFPIQQGKNRFHPTQKSLPLFEELIKKHSNEGDLVVDPFLGGGTTALACKNTNRNFKGCEIDKKFYDKLITSL